MDHFWVVEDASLKPSVSMDCSAKSPRASHGFRSREQTVNLATRTWQLCRSPSGKSMQPHRPSVRTDFTSQVAALHALYLTPHPFGRPWALPAVHRRLARPCSPLVTAPAARSTTSPGVNESRTRRTASVSTPPAPPASSVTPCATAPPWCWCIPQSTASPARAAARSALDAWRCRSAGSAGAPDCTTAGGPLPLR
jgi:hypothetical protein